KPASASFKMPMICSSVNRFFIAVPLWSGLYTVTVLNAGGRSAAPKVAKLVKETDEDWERLRNPTRAEGRAKRVPQ
ncbi:hypothetical protein, partial [Burkholderia ambifaria]|uniref:hypothetical protein n=1 Tax=Burkholderia ambifaria TaxID=152480 RepID=UPI001ABA1ED6